MGVDNPPTAPFPLPVYFLGRSLAFWATRHFLGKATLGALYIDSPFGFQVSASEHCTYIPILSRHNGYMLEREAWMTVEFLSAFDRDMPASTYAQV